MLTIGLVVMVIFLFLRSLSATIIPSVAVPLSLVGTFAVMYLLGYSLDNLSLMALTISTGFVVDDAIVMIENISRYLEEGDPPMEAALKGAEQIGFTIVSLTVSLIAVLIPLLFMGDVVGRLFREFAVTLAVTIIISAVVSLTLTPMMCARILRHTPESAAGHAFIAASENVFERMIAFYGRTLKVVLRFQTLTLLVALATLVLTVLLYIFIPKGFFPVQDTGVIQGISQAPQSISFDAMAEQQQAARRHHPQGPRRRKPLLLHRRRRHQHHAQQRPHLHQPQASRRAPHERLRRHPPVARQAWPASPGHPLYMQPVQDITVDDRVSRTQYQYTLEDPDTDELNSWTDTFVADMQEAAGARRRRHRPADRRPAPSSSSSTASPPRASASPPPPSTTPSTTPSASARSTPCTRSPTSTTSILEALPSFQTTPDKLQSIFLQSNASANATGAGAATSFSSSSSASAGSNATTESAQYTPTPAQSLLAPLQTALAKTTVTANSTLTNSSQLANAVPLNTFTHLPLVREPLTITHQGQFPAVTISFNLASKASLGTAISKIDDLAVKLNPPLRFATGPNPAPPGALTSPLEETN